VRLPSRSRTVSLRTTPVAYKRFQTRSYRSADGIWNALSPTRELIERPHILAYRGQALSIWKLIPSVLRDSPDNYVVRSWGREVKGEDQVFLEIHALQSFAEYCDKIGIRIPGDSREFREEVLRVDKQPRYTRQPHLWPNSDFFEVMAMAQHHGVPTRLIDWTRNPYAAVYFAASSAVSRARKLNESHRLAVWVLNLEAMNLYRRVEVVRIPGSVSVHLAAQDGLFTAHPHNGLRGQPFETVGLEEEFSTLPHTPLMKLTTPVGESVRLLELCDKIGINAATMYPGADGAGKAVMEDLNSWIAKRQIF